MRHLIHRLILSSALAAAASAASAATYTLDDPASPISAIFDSSGGKITVTSKADGFVWANPSSGGGDAVTISTVTQSDPLSLSAVWNGRGITIKLQLVPASGQLRVTLNGAAATVSGVGVNYPYSFFATGQGSASHAVVPLQSGYVIPASATSLQAQLNALGSQRMEWFGGTDSANAHGWAGIVETDADYLLQTQTGTFEGQSVIGAVPQWLSSNNNATHTGGKLSYDRTVRFQFASTGGYVGLAKQFRAYALQNGWLKTLAQKDLDDPGHKIEKLIGAPVLYLWGDGRTTALLNALKAGGVNKALVQVSLNDLDENKNFPATEYPNNAGWCQYVRSLGYVGGFYDIHNHIKTTGQTATTCPYDGYYYLWPANPSSLAYVASNGTPELDAVGWVTSMLQAAQFSAGTRMPAQLAQFDMDAYFFDTICAVLGHEDYNSSATYFATRGIDQSNRVALLNTAYGNATRHLVTGTERGLSYAVPVLHWAEGKFWLGAAGNVPDTVIGAWNDFAYPQIQVDVMDFSTTTPNYLPTLLSDGYQVPLWDLVYHDCIITTQHWTRAHNRFVYCWDQSDQWALLRGQAPIYNLTYQGTKGNAGRVPNSITDVNGVKWSTKWSDIGSRVLSSIQKVAGWHGQVGWYEMTQHQWLAADRSVQMAEFSPDGGINGRGIVVNFGNYDGAYGVTGATWSGTQRGTTLSVPLGQYATYAWSNGSTPLAITGVPGNVQLGFLGTPTTHYTLQFSNDLASWTNLTSFQNPGSTSTPFQYTDTSPAGPRRFYRLTIP